MSRYLAARIRTADREMKLSIRKPRGESAGQDEGVVSIVAAGDFCVHTSEMQRVVASDTSAVIGPALRSLFAGADLSFLNLECPLEPAAGGPPKAGVRLSGCPELVDVLLAAGIDVVGAANNHILDFGPEALRRTVDRCRAAGLDVVGAGETDAEASRPLVRDVRGVRVALLAFAEQEFSCASQRSAGAARLDPVSTGSAITKAKALADVVVVCAHGGNEYTFAPSPRMQSWYRFFVDCGANAVIGSHPHAVHGTEIYAGSPIVYSLGNFLFDSAQRRPACWDRGLVVRIDFSRAGATGIELVPTVQRFDAESARVELADGSEREAAEERIGQLNAIAADAEQVREMFRCFVEERRRSYRQRLAVDSTFIGTDVAPLVRAGLRTRSVWQLASAFSQWASHRLARHATREQRSARLTNLFQCPAHHELMTAILQSGTDERIDDALRADYQRLVEECR